jgi:hypothetical protein
LQRRAVVTARQLRPAGTSQNQSRRTLRDESLGRRFPGTSCLATILQSLRDGLQPDTTSKLKGHATTLPRVTQERDPERDSTILPYRSCRSVTLP